MKVLDVKPTSLVAVDTKPSNLSALDTKPRMSLVKQETVVYKLTLSEGQPMGLLLALTYPIADLNGQIRP